MSVLIIVGVLVALAVLVVGVRALRRQPRRVQIGIVVGILVYVGINRLLHQLGDDRNWPWQLAVAVLTVAVAADLLRQVPRLRPAPRAVAVAVVAWCLGSLLLTSIVIAVYVARRVMDLSVFPGTPQPVSSARSREMSGGASGASADVGRPAND